MSIRGIGGCEQHNSTMPSAYLTTSASASDDSVEHKNMIYSHVNKRSFVDELDMTRQYGVGGVSSLPTFQCQLNANTSTEFDNYSQVLSDEYEEDEMAATEVMNYGDIDVTSYPHNQYCHQNSKNCDSSRYQNIDSGSSMPYSLKTNTQHGSIVAGSNAYGHAYSNDQQSDLKNMYRAVEYQKGISL